MVINTAEVYGHISKWCIKKQTKKVKGDYKMIKGVFGGRSSEDVIVWLFDGQR